MTKKRQKKKRKRKKRRETISSPTVFKAHKNDFEKNTHLYTLVKLNKFLQHHQSNIMLSRILIVVWMQNNPGDFISRGVWRIRIHIFLVKYKLVVTFFFNYFEIKTKFTDHSSNLRIQVLQLMKMLYFLHNSHKPYVPNTITRLLRLFQREKKYQVILNECTQFLFKRCIRIVAPPFRMPTGSG